MEACIRTGSGGVCPSEGELRLLEEWRAGCCWGKIGSACGGTRSERGSAGSAGAGRVGPLCAPHSSAGSSSWIESC